MSGQRPSASTVLAGFRHGIEPVRVTGGYLFTLSVVAAAMLVLPVLYLLLIGAGAAGLVWWVREGFDLLRGTDDLRFATIVWVMVLVVGATVVFFLVKPLFARPARPHKPRRLEADREPVFFAFVERVAEMVGAPKPRSVEIDLQVNAAAGFRRGFLSLFSNDLVLTVGLPLVAGLSLQQLAGILAHELGHFAQRTAMRLNYVVRTINGWFARVVYERDAWDVRLARSRSESESLLVIVLVLIVQGCVWLARRFLWLLMMAGHAISCMMSRHMEYDADRYQARMVGVEDFAATQRDVLSLTAAQQHAIADLNEMWREQRLGDNLPRMVAAHRVRSEPGLEQAIERHLQRTEGVWFDTHPTDARRLASVRREAPSPAFVSDLPATILFSDFDHLARLESRALYEASLDTRVAPDALVPVGEVQAEQERTAGEDELIAGFFAGFHALRPLPLPAALPPEPADTLAAALAAEAQTAASALDAFRTSGGEAIEAYLNVWERLVQADEAAELLALGVPFQAGELGLPAASWEGLERARERAEARKGELEPKLETSEALAAERLLAGLRLARLDGHGTDEAAAGAWDGDETAALLACADLVRQLRPDLAALFNLDQRFYALATRFDATPENARPALNERIDLLFDRLCASLEEVHRRLSAVPYPLAQARQGLTVAAYALPELPPADQPPAVHQAVHHLFSGLLRLYVRVIGRLCAVAAAAERRAAGSI
ncbi:MAG TPA: M48 family metallopeptidase [Thermoanaerobaculia bacterium]|nr:M48 family metallopeptidase [Thermoanaerobaculia bacterium]